MHVLEGNSRLLRLHQKHTESSCDSSMSSGEEEKDFTSFCQPARPITCANYGNDEAPDLSSFHDGKESVLWQWEAAPRVQHAAHQLTHLPPSLHVGLDHAHNCDWIMIGLARQEQDNLNDNVMSCVHSGIGVRGDLKHTVNNTDSFLTP